MKYIQILLFYFILFISCNKNEKFIKTKINISKVDSLKTENEIEKLIGNIDSLYKKIELKQIKDINFEMSNDSIFKEVAKREKVNFTYQKADFDNNGLTDILAIGINNIYNSENFDPKLDVEFSKEFNTIVLMNFGKNKYKLFDISEEKFYPIIPKVIIENSEAFLKIYKPKLLNSRKNLKREETITKLTFKFNDFVDFNPNPKKYNIEKIEFNSKGCPGSCPIFKIEIASDREAKINASDFNYSKEWQKGNYIDGNYSTIIKEENFCELNNLLCYIDFPNLKKDYSLVTYHHPDGTLKITYDGGKIKIINDFGLVGTYGLKRVYDMLFKLRFNQNLKKK